MNKSRDFVNRFRYTILAVLIVVTIGYGYYLFRLYAPAPAPGPAPTVNVAVMVDGTIRIDGTLYATPDKLAPKVAALQKEHPDIGFNIQAAYGSNFEPTAKAVVLLKKSGARAIWVINEQKKPAQP